MIYAGIFGADEHLELVEGVLVSHAPPHNPPHAGTTARLTRLLGSRLGHRAILWVQLPIVVSARTEVEPDLALLFDRGHFYEEVLPRAPDVHAVLEVADTSLWYDRGRKLGIYAQSRIAEYWIVDVAKQGIQIYTQPEGKRYNACRLAVRGKHVSFAAFPDVIFSVDELLG